MLSLHRAVKRGSEKVEIFLPQFCKVNYTGSQVTEGSFPENLKEKLHVCQHSSKCDICQVSLKNNKLKDIQFSLDSHEKVVQSGKFNFEGCRIPVNNRLDINYLRSWLWDYKDTSLCSLLEFGFPLDCKESEKLFNCTNHRELWKFRNHTGATDYPEEMKKYLQKECKNQAVVGPFNKNPFNSGLRISPLNSVPKKETDERRVILDLSFPKGNGVNDFISKEEYLGEKMLTVYPKVDDLVQLIKLKGRGCLLFKKDLRRAYRQIPICPSSYNLVGFVWKKHIFFDSVLSMGLRNAAYICERVTTAISFIMFKIGILVLNYLDDLASAEVKEHAEFAYSTLGAVLDKCGFEEALDKSCSPSTVMTFVGVLFNTEKMTIEVTSDRLKEIRALIQFWLNKKFASLKEIQSLLGKLNFVAACVKPSRIFVSRLLVWLKVLYKGSQTQHLIPIYVKKDLLWWHRFLPLYNGVSMMLTEEWSEPDEIFSSVSLLQGCGGFWQGKFFHVEFPQSILVQNYHITILEMFAVVLAARLWSKFFKGKRIQVFCDNLAVCSVINTGRSKCTILQACLRELTFLTAMAECEIRAVHLESQSNRIADHLSRWSLDDFHKQQFFLLTNQFHLQEFVITDNMFQFLNDW